MERRPFFGHAPIADRYVNFMLYRHSFLRQFERDFYFVEPKSLGCMKRSLILCLFLLSCLLGHPQPYSIITVSTTTPVRDALHICKDVGESNGFDGIDYYRGLDSFSLTIKTPPDELIMTMLVSACPDRGMTILTVKLWCGAKILSRSRDWALKRYANRLSRKLEHPWVGVIAVRKGQMPFIDSLTVAREKESDWSGYPITTAKVYSAGLYERPSLFRRNIADSIAFELTWRKDSVYVMKLRDSLSAEQIRLHETLKEIKSRMYAWTMRHDRGVICYQGKLYFIVKYPICLPLEKSGDTFYFHIPRTYPSLRSLNQVREKDAQPLMGSDTGSADNVAAALLAALFIDMTEVFIRYEVEQSILRKGKKDKTMRDCYVDLNTGQAKCL